MNENVKALGLGLLVGAGAVSLVAVLGFLAILVLVGPDALVGWVLG